MPDNPNGPAQEAQQWSRYQQVKKILSDASGSAHPDYQGYGRFWELPLAEFLELSLYGVRMIAPVPAELSSCVEVPATPAPTSPCCHSAAPRAPAPPRPTSSSQTGRGAASGLIKGLKGEAPFDGVQFPRLPWGGVAVSLADIAFIEKWIDDGCQESDVPAGGLATAGAANLAALASGKAFFAAHAGPTNSFRESTGSVKVRKNVKFLTPEELQRFRCAVATMMSLDSFEQDERSFGYWARIHANQCQHSWEQFLTWHRAYLYYFEQRLQDVDPMVTLPYWDWAADRENVVISITDMGSDVSLDNGIVPDAYCCWIDQPGIDSLKSQGVPQATLDKLASIVGKTYSSGNRLYIAAGLKYGDDPASDAAIIQVLGTINPLWHYQRWPGGNKNIIFEAYPSPDDITRILQIENFFSFGSGPEDNHFFGALENIHNLIHNFSGGLNPNYNPSSGRPMDATNPQAGDMVNAGRTAFDPIFWAHHSNVDRLWSEWQVQHPNAGPDDATDILSPWNMTVGDTYSIAKLGYEYMQAAHSFPAPGSVPITRFVSQSVAVNPQVAATHRHAEVRLHRVQYSTRAGFFVRVFLNQPEANAATSTEGNPHYVGMQTMFTGLCIGGPGHCTPPPTTPRRKFDHRGRSHKSPAGFRMDCTDAIAQLREQGDTEFRVTLVVLNIDGTPATDALHLEGVSLNFFD